MATKVVEIEHHLGHFGDNSGAHSIVDEVHEARKIMLGVHAILVANGIPSNVYEDKTSKTQAANLNNLVAHHNKDNNALIVSYHLNCSAGVTKNGIGTEVCHKTQPTLAAKMSAAIAKAGGFKDRGAKYRNDLAVLNRTIEPAILLETFFVNSEYDVAQYHKNFDAICQAIATVLAGHLGHKIKAGAKVETGKEIKDMTHKKTNVKGTIKTLVADLNYYDSPRWTKPTGTVKKGTVLTVTDKISVNGAYQYKTLSGTYVTASDKYVQFNAK